MKRSTWLLLLYFAPGASLALVTLTTYHFGYYVESGSGHFVRARDIVVSEYKYSDGYLHLQIDNRPTAHRSMMFEANLNAAFSQSKVIKKESRSGNGNRCERKFRPMATHEANDSDTLNFRIDSCIETISTDKPYIRLSVDGANMMSISLNVPSEQNRLWTLVRGNAMTVVQPEAYATQNAAMDIDKRRQANRDSLEASYRTPKSGDATPSPANVFSMDGKQLSLEEKQSQVETLIQLMGRLEEFEKAFNEEYLDLVFGSNCTCTITVLISSGGRIGAIKILQPGAQTGLLIIENIESTSDLNEGASSKIPEQNTGKSSEDAEAEEDPLEKQNPEDLGMSESPCNCKNCQKKNYRKDDDDRDSNGGSRPPNNNRSFSKDVSSESGGRGSKTSSQTTGGDARSGCYDSGQLIASTAETSIPLRTISYSYALNNSHQLNIKRYELSKLNSSHVQYHQHKAGISSVGQ